jgi:hypothetical protein
VIDTAKGGYGINKLTELLVRLRKKCNSGSWIIRCHLFHAPEADVERIMEASHHSIDGVKFIIKLWEVNHLIVEDWDPSIGLRIEYGKNSFDIKKTSTDGTLRIVDDDFIYVVRSSDISAYVDTLFADAISDEIRTNPEFKHVEDVYHLYLDDKPI